MKYQVQYVRIEHQIYTLEVEADSEDQAEDKADEMFCDGDWEIIDVQPQEQTA
jgi:phosphoribosylformylglycinamidine (FGAM) synthase PurS component